MEESTFIFLSYAQQDREKVLTLYHKLSEEGFIPWIDVKNILPGEKRTVSIKRAIQEADFFLACLSTISVRERGFFQSQIKDALSLLNGMLESDIYFIPVRLEQCDLPEDLEDFQGADLFNDDGWEQLLKAIREGLERRRGKDDSGAAPPSISASSDTSGKLSLVIDMPRSWEVHEEGEGVVLRFPGREAIGKLQFRLESAHFIIHFGLRNPRSGKGLGPDGVRDQNLVNMYVDSLERCYKTLVSKPWDRQAPIVGMDGRTHVYVFNTLAFTATNLQLVPYICLPSGSSEPTSQAEFQLAASIAIHEVVNLFNYRERPFYDIQSSAWEWFNDAFASFIEALVSWENYEHLRLLSEWIDMSGVSLDDPTASNHAFIFIRYVANRMGLDFINKIWTESEPTEKPLETLIRLMPEGQRFASYDPDENDIFASGYCMDAYFLWEPSSGCFMPQAYQRYGDRAVSESVLLGSGEAETITDELDHLSCKYYRFYPKDNSSRLQISVLPAPSITVKPLKAEVAAVTKDKKRGSIQPLRLLSSSDSEGGERLSCEIPFYPEDLDHIVLVVSNCGLRGSLAYLDREHDDNKKYKIMISVI